MQAGMEPHSPESPPTEAAAIPDEDTNVRDEERAFIPADRTSSVHSAASGEEEARSGLLPPSDTTATARASSIHSSTAYIRRQTSRLLEAIKPSPQRDAGPVPPKLAALFAAFEGSAVRAALAQEIRDAAAAATPLARGGNGSTAELPDVAVESGITRGRKRASWGTQFRILSGRAFKNLYRDPALLAAHYISAVVVARECRPSVLDVLSRMARC